MGAGNMKIQVYAEYSDGCFCNRPEFTPVVVNSEPRFQWRKAVELVAKANGLTEIVFGKSKAANAYYPLPCRHRDKQLVRFDRHYV